MRVACLKCGTVSDYVLSAGACEKCGQPLHLPSAANAGRRENGGRDIDDLRAQDAIAPSRDNPSVAQPERVNWVLRIFASVMGIVLVVGSIMGLLKHEDSRSVEASVVMLPIGFAAIIQVGVRGRDVTWK